MFDIWQNSSMQYFNVMQMRTKKIWSWGRIRIKSVLWRFRFSFQGCNGGEPEAAYSYVTQVYLFWQKLYLAAKFSEELYLSNFYTIFQGRGNRYGEKLPLWRRGWYLQVDLRILLAKKIIILKILIENKLGILNILLANIL